MGLEWSDDVDQAQWVVERLHPVAQNVGSLVPDCFDAYARIFHPIAGSGGSPVRWSDLARRNGRIVHPEMQLHLIARPVGGDGKDVDRIDASVGSLPLPELVALTDSLRRHTSSPHECWFCVWDGYGQFHGSPAVGWLTADGHGGECDPLVPSEVLAGPRVRAPGREYLLLRGPLDEVSRLHGFLGQQSPNLWWPEDGAWCVATGIDLAWTYLGGSRALVADVRADPRLETLEAEAGHRFTHDSDLLNAVTPGPA